MNSPTVSVIIPAYNQANFLAEAIQSVLDQTYPDFELIVVNDASPDDTTGVVNQFQDPRVNYLIHEQNRGLPAARNTAMRASTGEIICLLDADDIFHPTKLEAHVAFLKANPAIGVSYNARYELNYSARTIRELTRPPRQVDLTDLVLGFPFAPSDMVLRRDWAFRVNLFDESYVFFSEDLDINCRLALAGCRFASVDQILNSRRHHSGRVVKNIAKRLEAACRALDGIFADPRCPAEVLALKNEAYKNNYLVWGYHALNQNETELGQAYLRKAARLVPEILSGSPCPLVNFLISNSISDESVDHVALLHNIFTQLPAEMQTIAKQQTWAIAQGFVLKGVRAIMWGRPEDGHRHLQQAESWGAVLPDTAVAKMVHQLLDMEAFFGVDHVNDIVQQLAPFLKKLGGSAAARSLKGLLAVNKAFQRYEARQYPEALGNVAQAIAHNPKYVANRGIMSLLARSLVGGQPVENK
jgi:glycosyltransferase involved in cell wall biosynthesis